MKETEEKKGQEKKDEEWEEGEKKQFGEPLPGTEEDNVRAFFFSVRKTSRCRSARREERKGR